MTNILEPVFPYSQDTGILRESVMCENAVAPFATLTAQYPSLGSTKACVTRLFPRASPFQLYFFDEELFFLIIACAVKVWAASGPGDFVSVLVPKYSFVAIEKFLHRADDKRALDKLSGELVVDGHQFNPDDTVMRLVQVHFEKKSM